MRRKSPNLLVLVTLLCTVFFSSCQQVPDVQPQSDGTSSKLNGIDPVDPIDQGLAIPLGGNGFITKKAVTATETITAAGLSNWRNSDAIITTFFKANTTGQLYIAFRAAVPNGISSVKVTVNGKPYTVSNITGTDYKKYRVGVINITSPGYIKLDMQGISNSANAVYANVSDIIIYGNAASGATFANDASVYEVSRAGAGVSLQYNTNGQNAQWFYNELTVPSGSENAGTNFISNGFNGGYAGLQMTAGAAKRIMFFVSNPDGDVAKIVKKGANAIEDATVSNGKFVYLPFNWKINTTYKFLTQIKTDGNGYTSFSSWVYTPEDNQWKLIASTSRANSGSYLTGLYSAIQGTNPDNGYIQRRVRSYNQWINTDNVWTEVTTATFNGDATAVNKQRLDYSASVEYSAFYLRTQGFFSDNLTLNSSLSRTATMSQPSVDLNTLP